jgi:hypothetical protein
VKRIFASLVLVGLLSMTALGAAADSTTEVVTEASVARQAEDTPPTDNWVLYTRTGTLATAGAFVEGPGTPPLGTGSLEFTTATGGEKVFLFNFDHVGTPLADINAIGYKTYRTSGSLQQVTALNIQVDFNGDATGGFTTLVFEPVYNTNQGAVVNGEWQTWDAYAAGQATWWSSRAIPGVCAFDCFVAWDTILVSNPDAVILGGFGVNQGSGNPGLVTAVDALTLGAGDNVVTYNFEAHLRPATADDCKDGGWATFSDPTFKNQGDCIQYMTTGK